MHPVKTEPATISDLADLVPLFDEYRQFYGKTSDTDAAEAFLRARLLARESSLFIARHGSQALGFVQLYPSFSSAVLGRTFILNDLYVRSAARRKGVGRMLLFAVEKFAREQGAVRLTLATEVTNHQAQALYAAMGWTRDELFHVYHRAI